MLVKLWKNSAVPTHAIEQYHQMHLNMLSSALRGARGISSGTFHLNGSSSEVHWKSVNVEGTDGTFLNTLIFSRDQAFQNSLWCMHRNKMLNWLLVQRECVDRWLLALNNQNPIDEVTKSTLIWLKNKEWPELNPAHWVQCSPMLCLHWFLSILIRVHPAEIKQWCPLVNKKATEDAPDSNKATGCMQ